MSTATAPPLPSPPASAAQPVAPPPVSTRRRTYGLDPSIYRFSVAQYERMAELGILGPKDKVELLEGYVVVKMARDPAHDSTIQKIQRSLFRVVPPGWDVRIQLAVRLFDSVPEPDFAVVRGDHSTYRTHHPLPTDVGLIIEVANTSLERDIEEKSLIYARSSIVAYWVIDVTNGLVHVFTKPSGPTEPPAFADHAVIRPPAMVPLTLDGAVIAPIPAADLLP